jgi:hypothetical protein
MNVRRTVLAVGLAQAALASMLSEDRQRNGEEDLRGVDLDDLELGPDGIQRKTAIRDARQPVHYRDQVQPPPPPIRPGSRFDRITGRTDEDILERMSKQQAKAMRRAAAAGLEYRPTPTPAGFDPVPELAE